MEGQEQNIPEVQEKERGITITDIPVVTNPNKRVNVISKHIIDENDVVLQQGGILLRTTRSYAAKLIAAGTHTTTSKNKLKSFLNKSMKLHKNARTLDTMIPKIDKAGNIVYEKDKITPVMVKKYDLENKKAGHLLH